MRPVARYDKRKVVVATNVAETSLTIDGVRLVIDSGLARKALYDSNRGINTLLIEKFRNPAVINAPVELGRTAPGVCMRLGHAKNMGIVCYRNCRKSNVSTCPKSYSRSRRRVWRTYEKFRWLEAPDEVSLKHAEELLADLGALKSGSAATPGLHRSAPR